MKYAGKRAQLRGYATEADFEVTWAAIDHNEDGQLSLEELARYYGFDLHANDNANMSDEQILDLLALQAHLFEEEFEKLSIPSHAKQPTLKVKPVGPRQESASAYAASALSSRQRAVCARLTLRGRSQHEVST